MERPAPHWIDRAHAWFRWGNVLLLLAITLLMIASSADRHSLLEISATLGFIWMVLFGPLYPILSLLWIWKGRQLSLGRRILRAIFWGLWLLLWGALTTLMHA